jgi:hypothetical protein
MGGSVVGCCNGSLLGVINAGHVSDGTRPTAYATPN